MATANWWELENKNWWEEPPKSTTSFYDLFNNPNLAALNPDNPLYALPQVPNLTVMGNIPAMPLPGGTATGPNIPDLTVMGNQGIQQPNLSVMGNVPPLPGATPQKLFAPNMPPIGPYGNDLQSQIAAWNKQRQWKWTPEQQTPPPEVAPPPLVSQWMKDNPNSWGSLGVTDPYAIQQLSKLLGAPTAATGRSLSVDRDPGIKLPSLSALPSSHYPGGGNLTLPPGGGTATGFNSFGLPQELIDLINNALPGEGNEPGGGILGTIGDIWNKAQNPLMIISAIGGIIANILTQARAGQLSEENLNQLKKYSELMDQFAKFYPQLMQQALQSGDAYNSLVQAFGAQYPELLRQAVSTGSTFENIYNTVLSQVPGKYMNLFDKYAAMTPQDTVAGIQQIQQPLSRNLMNSIMRQIQAQLGERGLAQAPGIMTEQLSQTLAPYEIELAKQAQAAYFDTLGLPMKVQVPNLQAPLGLPQQSFPGPLQVPSLPGHPGFYNLPNIDIAPIIQSLAAGGGMGGAGGTGGTGGTGGVVPGPTPLPVPVPPLPPMPPPSPPTPPLPPGPTGPTGPTFPPLPPTPPPVINPPPVEPPVPPGTVDTTVHYPGFPGEPTATPGFVPPGSFQIFIGGFGNVMYDPTTGIAWDENGNPISAQTVLESGGQYPPKNLGEGSYYTPWGGFNAGLWFDPTKGLYIDPLSGLWMSQEVAQAITDDLLLQQNLSNYQPRGPNFKGYNPFDMAQIEIQGQPGTPDVRVVITYP